MTEYEKMGGTYSHTGDYILPNLTVGTQAMIYIGVWGAGVRWTPLSVAQKHRPSRQARQRHRRYLKEHHKVRYYNLLTAGTLDSHLADIESQAQEMFEQTVKSLAEKENVTENLKATAPMEWVQKMNNIRNRTTEIVNTEVILYEQILFLSY